MYFGEENKSYDYTIARIIAYVNIMFLTICPIFWIVSSRMTIFRIIFLVSLSSTFAISSVASSLGANIYLNKVEDKLSISNNYINYLKRFLLIIYGAVSIACSISVTKSALYLSEISEYSFGSELKVMIDNNAKDDSQNNKLNKDNTLAFLNDIKLINQDSLKVVRENIFSFITGDYILEIDENSDFELSYSYYGGSSKSGGVPVHNISYSKKSDKVKSFVNYGSPKNGSFEYINTRILIERINNQIQEFDSIEKQIENKPADLFHFAFSSLMDLINVKGYEINPKNNISENIDFGLNCFFWILTTFFFFEFTRKKTNKT